MVTQIMQSEPAYYLNTDELNFFLKGNTSLDSPKDKKPYNWISDLGWKDLQVLVTLGKKYENVVNDLIDYEDVWKKWYDESDPENTKDFPMGLALTKFQQLLLLRIFRPDRVYNGMKNFIVDFFDGNMHYV